MMINSRHKFVFLLSFTIVMTFLQGCGKDEQGTKTSIIIKWNNDEFLNVSQWVAIDGKNKKLIENNAGDFDKASKIYAIFSGGCDFSNYIDKSVSSTKEASIDKGIQKNIETTLSESQIAFKKIDNSKLMTSSNVIRQNYEKFLNLYDFVQNQSAIKTSAELNHKIESKIDNRETIIENIISLDISKFLKCKMNLIEITHDKN